MLPCCALVRLVEVSRRPAEWSGQVWLKDKRLTGSRLCWSAKLKDEDKGIKDGKVEEGRQAGWLSAAKRIEDLGLIVETQDSEQWACFYRLAGQEFAFLSSMCCVDLEKVYYRVPSGVLRDVTCESFDTRRRRILCILGIRWGPSDSDRGVWFPLSCLWYL